MLKIVQRTKCRSRFRSWLTCVFAGPYSVIPQSVKGKAKFVAWTRARRARPREVDNLIGLPTMV